MSSPFAQEVRTKGSILSSLSRNDPIQPLDFTLRSRYETISISFAEGPSGTEDFFDISRRFGILYGPLYLNPSALHPHPLVLSRSPSLFTPRSTHIAPIESRGTGGACCSITRTLAYERIAQRVPISRSYYYCPSFTSVVFSFMIPP